MIVALYVGSDDAAARTWREQNGHAGPRPDGSDARLFRRWAGELADAIARRAAPRAAAIARELAPTPVPF